jgi:hypothetical protein
MGSPTNMSEIDRVLSRFHETINTRSNAVFSNCGKYRYSLNRSWSMDSLFDESPRSRQFIAFCCLNPSTATQIDNDPTVTRCINYAKAWGFGGYVMINAFAWRETLPGEMKLQPEPIGECNDAMLELVVSMAGMTVAGWGCDGAHLGRHEHLSNLLPRHGDIYRLKETAGGFPIHPLYQRKDLIPQLWLPRKTA